MQALFDVIAALLSGLAALAFAQFGVSLHGKPDARPRSPEVRRTVPDQRARASCDQHPPVIRIARRA
jgi:hypothetical protein